MLRQATLASFLVCFLAGVAAAEGGAPFFDRDPERARLIERAEVDFLKLPRPPQYCVGFSGKLGLDMCVGLLDQWEAVVSRYHEFILFEMTRKYVVMPEHRYEAFVLLAGAGGGAIISLNPCRLGAELPRIGWIV